MSKNTLTGSVIAPLYFGPGIDQAPGNVLSGNLSTSDGADVINVPRVSLANADSLVINTGGDPNTLRCSTALTFDGDTVDIVGHLTASLTISASIYYGDSIVVGSAHLGGAVAYNRSEVSVDYTVTSGDYYVGVDSTSNIVKVTLPAANTLTNGHTIIVKDEGGQSDTHNITVSGSVGSGDTIDGENQVILSSPFAAIQLYCNGVNKFFIA